MSTESAREAIRVCQLLATYSEERGATTRTFLSPPMRHVHAYLASWMARNGMAVRVDAAGNLRGVYAAADADAPRLIIGSHLDTVPDAGAFDGVLGVVLGIALVEELHGTRFPFAIEVVGFSDEEGVRFGVPFLGSRALVGTLDEPLLGQRDRTGVSVREAIANFGLGPTELSDAKVADAIAYLEFHIEQGPTLDMARRPLGIVDGIVGQTRVNAGFTGTASHAGTTPMASRRDALAGAAEWILAVEQEARTVPGLVATVGRLEVEPGAANVIAGHCLVSLDVRHVDDRARSDATVRAAKSASDIAARRGLDLSWDVRLDQVAVGMDDGLTAMLARAVTRHDFPLHHLSSGAGHDAMVMAEQMPVAMLFLRSPGGISHHPGESVVEGDVAAALLVGRQFLDELARSTLWRS